MAKIKTNKEFDWNSITKSKYISKEGSIISLLYPNSQDRWCYFQTKVPQCISTFSINISLMILDIERFQVWIAQKKGKMQEKEGGGEKVERGENVL